MPSLPLWRLPYFHFKGRIVKCSSSRAGIGWSEQTESSHIYAKHCSMYTAKGSWFRTHMCSKHKDQQCTYNVNVKLCNEWHCLGDWLVCTGWDSHICAKRKKGAQHKDKIVQCRSVPHRLVGLQKNPQIVQFTMCTVYNVHSCDIERRLVGLQTQDAGDQSSWRSTRAFHQHLWAKPVHLSYQRENRSDIWIILLESNI